MDPYEKYDMVFHAAAPARGWASPLHAEVMQKRSIDSQTFYRVKLIFPRGDAASVAFGFDAAGKITGVAVESMAGD